jgi:hypothetical protein
MGKLKVTVTGIPTKKPKINDDGTVDLIFKAEMSPSVPKGLKSLGATLCLVHISKKAWKKVSDKVVDDSFFIIQGEGKSRVNSKQVPFLEVVTFDINLRDPKDDKKEAVKDTKTAEPKKEVKVKPPKATPQTEQKKAPTKKEFIPMLTKWYEESEIKYVSYNDLILTENIHLKTKAINLNSIFYVINKSENKKINAPIAVKKVDGKYSLIMGLRHFVVAKVLQIDKVCICQVKIDPFYILKLTPLN